MEHPFGKTQNSISKDAIVVYGTCSGNAEIVAQAITDGLKHSGLNVIIDKSELIKAEKVIGFGLIVLVSSTWDVGKLNMNFVKFDKEFKQLDLSSHKIAIVGLGDSKNYDVFCGSADIMEQSVEKTGATKLVETLRIDGSPYSNLEEYRMWGENLGKLFSNR